MRPCAGRFMQILKRGEVPNHLQNRVVPPLQHSNAIPQLTLVEQLIARKEAREKEYEAAQKAAHENGELTLGADSAVKPWPTNLRIEPVVKREAFSKVAKDVRSQMKEALRER